MAHNAYIYCRCASYKQRDPLPESIEKQGRLCRRYAEKENISVVETITDIGVSGLSENREGFDRLLALLRDLPKPRAVIIASPDRLARSLDILFRLKEKIEGVEATLLIAHEGGSTIA